MVNCIGCVFLDIVLLIVLCYLLLMRSFMLKFCCHCGARFDD